jgi:ribose transport system permease protein
MMPGTLRDALVRLRGSILLPLLLGLLLVVVGAMLIDGFASFRSLRAILVLASFVGLAAVGQSLVIVMGGIDLSIPFIVSFANIVAAEAFGAGIADPVVVLLVVGLSAAIGAVNGFLARRFRVHPLIITLGVGTAVVAAALWWTAGFPSGRSPDWVTGFVSIGASTGPLPVPPIVVLWLLVAIGVVIVERSTSYGRRLFALGSNPRAAELALVRPLRLWVATFAISASFAGITGLLYLGFTGKASGTVGEPLLGGRDRRDVADRRLWGLRAHRPGRDRAYPSEHAPPRPRRRLHAHPGRHGCPHHPPGLSVRARAARARHHLNGHRPAAGGHGKTGHEEVQA